MKKILYIFCFSLAVISCDDLSKKLEEVTQGTESTMDKAAAEITELSPQERLINKMVEKDWQFAYQTKNPLYPKHYIKFDPPTVINEEITGDLQFKSVYEKNEIIHFYQYRFVSESKLGLIMKEKYFENGEEKIRGNIDIENNYHHFIRFLDEGNTLTWSEFDPIKESDNNQGQFVIFKQDVNKIEGDLSKSPGQLWMEKINYIRSKEWIDASSLTLKFSEPILVNDVVKCDFIYNNMKYTFESISENEAKISKMIYTDSDGTQKDVIEHYLNSGEYSRILKLDFLNDGKWLVIDKSDGIEMFHSK